ncbi:class I SAM-dependent methyltransferase [Paenibacillus puldeungensis]|uniref:Class I SAM-dependent methyltransferase n=1 Tax=Paenibacillus puldeungensis TaxID=696536 RepID=A0ABW3RYW1_9BACL
MDLYDEQKEYWNRVAESKQFTTPFERNEFARYVRNADRILDVGCGYGRTLQELYLSGYTNLLGIDFSASMIARGKQLYPHLDLKTLDNQTIDLPDSSVQAVIMFAVLTCIVSNEEQLSLFREIRRVLKPSGILYINDFLLNHDERNLARYEEYAEKYGTYGVFELPEGAVLRHHDLAWVKTLTEGFEPLQLEQVTYTTMNGNHSNGYYYFGKNIKQENP